MTPKPGAMIKRAEKLLREHGFVLRVGGCGCCNSPWIYLSYKGKPIVFSDTGDGSIEGWSIEMKEDT